VNAKASTPDEGAFHLGQLKPIIDSDPFFPGLARRQAHLGHFEARGLSEADNHVTLLLVQNAVLAARRSAQAPQLRAVVSTALRYSPTTSRSHERGINASSGTSSSAL
jgi:hypothetical protein